MCVTVVLSAFIAETQTAHALEKKVGGLDGEYSIFFWRLFGKTREEESRANLARFLRSYTSVFCE